MSTAIDRTIPESDSNYQSGGSDEHQQLNNRLISTRDLISWSFQMDYLVSKKVLHGDLAARDFWWATASLKWPILNWLGNSTTTTITRKTEIQEARLSYNQIDMNQCNLI